MTSAASAISSVAIDTTCRIVCSEDGSGLNAKPIAMSNTAVPALNLKNLTPAAFPTHAKTRMMPTPRWVRNKNKMEDSDIQRLSTIGIPGWGFGTRDRDYCPASLVSHPSSQVITSLAELI